MVSTGSGLAYERAGAGAAVILLHAGVADSSMWDPQWAPLAESFDVVRLDLRGFGQSAAPPSSGVVSHVGDLRETLDELGVERAHFVGASFGGGVAAELAVTAPDRVASLLLCPPGGSLLAEVTDDFAAFLDAERHALADGDLARAAQVNLRTWVYGPDRSALDVDPGLAEHVRRMQLRAFELATTLDFLDDVELDPPVCQRLGDIRCPTMVLVGAFDLDATKLAAESIVAAVPGARRVDWPDVAHLPSMEQPARFLDLAREWLGEQSS